MPAIEIVALPKVAGTARSYVRAGTTRQTVGRVSGCIA